MKFFEEIEIGEVMEVGRHTFTAADIKSFAARYDPQPFHLDEAAAERSHFGRLCASGWHTVCVWMRLWVDLHRRQDEARRAGGERTAGLGPSPGFRELKWLKPVYAGDTVGFSTEVIATRPLATRPQWGLVSMRHVGKNQHGEPVISFESSVFVERRPGGPSSQP
jgi:acyl dehydratase